MIDTKLLRQKILDLAIRGKLVPQDPNDEPASELLKRIKAEKEALIKAGKIKRDKHESYIFRGEDKRYYEQIDGKAIDITQEIPFDLPMGWTWCRLHEIYSENNVGIVIRPTQYYTSSDKGIPAFRNTNIKPNKIDETSWVYLSHHGIQDNPRCIVHENDLLVSRSGNAGICCVATKKYEGYGAVDILLISLFPFCSSFFISNCINSPIVQQAISRNNRGVALSHIGTNTFANILLPLPPFSEQKRIVVQIDSLLKCLEEINQESETLEKSLTLAKQKILDLAISGKLVPQDPNDEPASELLKKIKAEKETLIKSGKLKRDKHESFIFRGDDNCYYEQIDGKRTDITEDIPFDIPESWCWCRLSALCDYGSCQSLDAGVIPGDAWVLDLEDIEKETGRLLCRITKRDRPSASSKHVFRKGNVLYSKLRTYLNKVLVADQDGYCTSEILPLDFGKYVLPEYARSVLMSRMFLDYTAQCGYGVKMPRLGTEDGRKALFPLPPLREQARIVGSILSLKTILMSLQEQD